MISYNYTKKVNSDRLEQEILIENLDLSHIETVDNSLIIWFNNELSQNDKTLLDSLIQNHQSTNSTDTINIIIKNATSFGTTLINRFVIENITMGITQAGKTKSVSDYCHKLLHYISTGSLYAAIQEIDNLIAQGLDSSLEPFITEQRLLIYKTEIQTYLGL